MPIVPLPQFEADLEADRRERLIVSLVGRGHERAGIEGLPAEDLERLERKKAPSTLVVRYGATMMIGEFPYTGDITPGCGSRVVVRTHRGTEIGEMLTATCPNSGCGSSVSRQQMLEYIENSGGRQYPFSTDGRVLRVATREDMDAQARIEQSRHGLRLEARAIAESLGLPMKIVDAEPILGGERMTYYYTSDDRVDFRDLVRELGGLHRARVDLRQVGARDEARITADYEKCGQYCCCKNFLKVLRPVNMKSAKVQKATLDPVKISGRCGRLMCCLRYEDETYEDLAKRLPKRKARVGTPDGDGLVISTQILTQLVLVRLEDSGEEQAYPVEEIGAPGERRASSGPARQAPAKPVRRDRPVRPDRAPVPAAPPTPAPHPGAEAAEQATGDETGTRRKRKRRRRRSAGEPGAEAAPAVEARAGLSPGDETTGDETTGGEATGGEATGPRGSSASGAPDTAEAQGGGEPRKKRRRRRRRRGGGGAGEGPAGGDPEGGGSAD